MRINNDFNAMEDIMRKAFTLAEVLVTLGILGVVAAVTMPTLVQGHQKKVYATQLHKFYTETTLALKSYVNDKNAVNLVEAGLTNKAATIDFLTRYFNVVQDCGEDYVPCFGEQYSSMDGKFKPNYGNKAWTCQKVVSIASGVAICMDAAPITGDINAGHVGVMEIDINGPKGPNIFGRDAFTLSIFPDGVIDDSNLTIDCRRNGNCGEADSPQALREANFTTSGHIGPGKLLNDNWEMTY